MNENSDITPQQTRSVHQDGTQMPLRLFPANYTQKIVFQKCNEDRSNLELPPVSQSNLSNICRRYFTNVAITKSTLFAKCDE